MDENFEPLGVLGQNIIPNQWAYLDVTFDTLINRYYYVVFYKAGTEEPYKGGDINSSVTSGDEYGFTYVNGENVYNKKRENDSRQGFKTFSVEVCGLHTPKHVCQPRYL